VDPALIETVSVPGLLPPRQARSRKAVSDLVEAALRMLATHDFETLSVAELCAEAGLTTGAFYKRFPSKELFVEYLQRLVVAEVRAGIDTGLAAQRWGGLALRDFLGRTVGGTVRWYRRYEGFVRASLRYAESHPESWSPMRETGARYAATVEPIVLRIVARPGAPALRDAIRFAVQMMLGTLNSMVLIDPGPFRLRDDRTIGMLTEAVATLVEAAGAGAAPAAQSPGGARRGMRG